MANKHGEFIWYELMTREPERAKDFYEAVVGWRIGDPVGGDVDYRMIGIGDEYVGGVLGLTEAMCEGGASPTWLGYVGVDDVDTTVAKLQRLGGTVLMPAWDLPRVGRIAMVTDPQGIPFYVMRGAVEDGTSTAFKHAAVGHCAWNELTTMSQDDALAFYAELFGWISKEAMSMGELGEYKFIHHHGDMIGAASPCTDEMRAPSWTYYFYVADIQAAAAETKAGGGKVLFGPEEIPGGDYIIIGTDPDGATFALVGPKGEQ